MKTCIIVSILLIPFSAYAMENRNDSDSHTENIRACLIKNKENTKIYIPTEHKAQIAFIAFKNNKICNLWVDKDQRKQSYGSLLFLEAIKIIQNEGHPCALLTSVNNSIPFYRQFGAQLCELPGYSVSGYRAKMKLDFTKVPDPEDYYYSHKEQFIPLTSCKKNYSNSTPPTNHQEVSLPQ